MSKWITFALVLIILLQTLTLLWLSEALVKLDGLYVRMVNVEYKVIKSITEGVSTPQPAICEPPCRVIGE